MAGGTRELTNPADMQRMSNLRNSDLIPAALQDGTPVAIEGSAFLGSDGDTVMSADVRNITRLTQSQYNALSPKDAQTLYIIVG